MILGMSVYFLMHGVLGLVGILAGFFLLSGLLAAKRSEGWTAIFLAATVATSFKGVGFPFVGLTRRSPAAFRCCDGFTGVPSRP